MIWNWTRDIASSYEESRFADWSQRRFDHTPDGYHALKNGDSLDNVSEEVVVQGVLLPNQMTQKQRQATQQPMLIDIVPQKSEPGDKSNFKITVRAEHG